MSTTLSKTGKALLYAIILIPCLSGIWFSSQWMLAGLAQHQVEQIMINENWNAQAPPPADTWQAMRSKLDTRLVYGTKLSQPLRELGLLYEMQPMGVENDEISGSAESGEGEDSEIGNWPEALSVYRHVITLSPGWPDDWGRLAWAKFMLGELDNEFLGALQNALMLGTEENRLDLQLSILSPIGMAMQPDADSFLYFLTDTYIRKSLQGGENYDLTLNALENTGLLATYCQDLSVMTTPAPVLNRCATLNNPDTLDTLDTPAQ